MSTSTQPLSSDARVPLSRVSLNSTSTNLILDSDTNQSSFLVVTNSTPSLYIDKFQNVGINTTSPTHQLDINSPNGSCLRLVFNSTNNTAQFTVNNSGVLTITPSGEEVQIPTSKNLNIKSHNGTTGLKLNDTLVTSSATQLNYVNVTPGTVSASRALVVGSNRDIATIRNITSDGLITSVGLTSSGAITLTDTTESSSISTGSLKVSGGAGITKNVNVGGSLSVVGTITGTLGIGAQSGITGVGTLTSLSVLSSAMPSMAIQSSYTTGITSASVASEYDMYLRRNTSSNIAMGLAFLISSNDIVPGATITLTRTGTNSSGDLLFSTKEVGGTLSEHMRILSTGRIGIRTNAPGRQLEVNASDGNCLRLSFNAPSGSATTYLDQVISSTGAVTMTAAGSLPSYTFSGGSISITDTTASTSTLVGALKISGGISISNSTEAQDITNGGSFTTAGGMAIGKKLFVGSDLAVSGNASIIGNLTVSGTTITVNSTNTLIKDNTIILNSGPSGTGIDSGLLTERYQVDITNGTGDVVNDTPKETYPISSATSTTITLPFGANTTDDYYKNWWIKVTSGSAANQVRKIIGYVGGTTRTATLSSAFLSNVPVATNTINLYNKSFSALLWQETGKQFITAFTSNDTSSNALTIIDYANLQTNNLTTQNITSNGTVSITNNSTIALSVTGGSSIGGNVSVGGTLTSTGLISGTLAAGPQTGITSVGTLSGLSSTGSISTTDGTESTSVSTGSLRTSGGIGVAKSVVIGGRLTFGATATSASAWGITGIQSAASTTTYTDTSSSGAVTSAVFNSYGQPTLTSTNTSTFANAATVYIANAPTASTNTTITNPYSLWIASGRVLFGDNTVSASTTSGALVVSGGIGVGGNSTIGGITSITNNTASTLVSNGALVVTGGIGVTGNSTLGGVISITNNTASTLISNGALVVSGGIGVGGNSTIGGITSITNNTASTLVSNGALVVTGGIGVTGNSTLGGVISITNSTASTLVSNGALVVTGGIGVGGNSTIGGITSITNNTASSSNSTGALVVTGGIGIINSTDATSTTNGGALTIAGGLAVAKKIYVGSNTASSSTTTGSIIVTGGIGVSAASTIGGILSITDATESTTTSTGSLKVSGGVGIVKSVVIGGRLTFGATAASASAWGTTGIQSAASATTYTDTSSSGPVGSVVFNSYGQPTLVSSSVSTFTNAATMYIANAPSASTNTTITNPYSLWIASGRVLFGDTTASTSITSGALIVTGGIGIGGNSTIGGVLSITDTTDSTSTSTGSLKVSGGIGIVKSVVIGGKLTFGTTAASASAWGTTGIQSAASSTTYTDTSSSGTVASVVFNSYGQPTLVSSSASTFTNAATVYIANAPTASTNTTITNPYSLWVASGRVMIGDSTASTSSTSGALVVSGGLGVSGDIRTNADIYGTIKTPSQPNITTIGTLTNLSTGTITLGGTLITATAADINSLQGSSNSQFSYLSGVTEGVVSASKAMVVNSSKNISGLNDLSMTGAITGVTNITASGTISGTLGSGAQTGITAVGTLTSLNISGTTSNILAMSTNASTTLTTSSNTDQYDMYIRKSNATNGLTCGIAFSITNTAASSALPGGSILFTRTGASGGHLSLFTTATERLRVSDTGDITVYSTTASSGVSSGALIVSGGIGVNSASTIGGILSITDATESTTTSTGSLKVSGGIGVLKSVTVGGRVISGGVSSSSAAWGTTGIQTARLATNFTDTSTYTGGGTVASVVFNSFGRPTLTTSASTTNNVVYTNGATVYIDNAPNTSGSSPNNPTITNAYSLWIPAGKVLFGDNTPSTSSTSGALVITGGLGVSGDIRTSADIYGTIKTAAQTSITSLGTLSTLAISGSITSVTNITASGTIAGATLTGTLSAGPQTGINAVGTLTGLSSSGIVSISDTTVSSSSTTGALTVTGGTGLNHVNIGGNRTLTSWGATGPLFNTVSSTITESSTAQNGTNNVTIAMNSFQSPTLAASNTGVTFSYATNVFIGDGPAAGSNATISSKSALLTDGAIAINGVSRNISNWLSPFLHLRSGYGTSVFTDTGSSNITGVIGINTFSGVDFASNTSGRTMTRTATMYIIRAPGTSGANMTLTNTHALYIAAGNTTLADSTASTSTTSGALVVTGGIGIGGNSTLGGIISITNNTASTAVGNGALVVTGGIGVTGNSTLGGVISITNNTASTTTSNGALVVTGGIGVGGDIRSGGNIYGTIATSSQTGITAIGTLTNLSTGTITLGGTAITSSAAEINYLSGVTLGAIAASKVLTVDSSSNINSILRLKKTASDQQIYFENGTSNGAIYHNLNGDIDIGTLSSNGLRLYTNNLIRLSISSSGVTNIQGGWQISGTTVSSSATELNYLNGVTLGTITASKALTVDSSSFINSVLKLKKSGNGQQLTFDAGTSQGVIYHYLDADLYIGTISNHNLVFQSNNAARLTISNAGIILVSNATDATSTIAASVRLAGGMGVVKSVVIGGKLTFGGTATSASAWGVTGIQSTAVATTYTDTSSSGTVASAVFNSYAQPTLAATTASTFTNAATVYIANAPAASTNATLTNTYSLWIPSGKVLLEDATVSSSTTTGALVVTGGLGVGGDIRSGGNIYGTIATASQTGITSVGTLSSLTLNGPISGATTITANNIVSLSGNIQSTSKTSGTLVVTGGIGVSGSIYTNDFKMITNGSTMASMVSSTASMRFYAHTDNACYIQTGDASETSGSCRDLFIGDLGRTFDASTNRRIMFKGGVVGTNANAGFAGFGTISPDRQVEINNPTGQCLRLTYNDSDGSATNYTDFTVSSGGNLTITSSGDTVSIASNDHFDISGHNASSIGLKLGGTLITASAAELNYLDLPTGPGTADATKALVVDVNKDITGIRNLSISGNLTVSGTTTTISSTNTVVSDNTLLLNSGPAGTGYDSGLLTQRFQNDNNAGTGDVANDTAKESYALSAASASTITLPSGANASDSYYNNWYIKITSGTGINQVRRITAYVGSTRVATLSSNFATTPVATNTVNLYNKSNTTILWKESAKQFITAFAANDTSAGALTIIDYADLRTNSLISNSTSLGGTARSASAWGVTGIQSAALATTYTDSSSSGTVASVAFNSYAQPTLASSSTSTFTNASTVYIANAPAASTNTTLTNSYSLWIPSGKVLLGDSTAASSSTAAALVVTGGLGVGGDIRSGGSAIRIDSSTGSFYGAGTGTMGRYIGNWTGSNYWAIGAQSSNQVRIGTSNGTGTWIGYSDVFMQRPFIISSGVGLSHKNTDVSSTELVTYNDGTMTGIGSFSSHDFRLYSADISRMVVKSTGVVGIGTNAPDRQLEINHATGQCLRLTYNDADGTASTYCDQTLSSTGAVTFTAAGSAPNFVMAGGAVAITNNSASSSTTTGSLVVTGGIGVGGNSTFGGIVKLIGSGDMLQMDSSTAGTGARSTILFTGNAYTWEFGTRNSAGGPNNAMYMYSKKNDGTENSIRMTLLNDGRVGIGSTAPDRQLEINHATGQCLRLTYNTGGGSATTYADLSVSSTGQLTLAPSSNFANDATSGSADILLRGSIVVGKDASTNLIRFNGVTGDTSNDFTVIGERLYNNTDQSELILFKGNDVGGGSGPDRIRLRAAEIRIQTFTSNETFSGSANVAMQDNNNRLVITNNGNVGINTTAPSYTLDVNGTLQSASIITNGTISSNLYSNTAYGNLANAKTWTNLVWSPDQQKFVAIADNYNTRVAISTNGSSYTESVPTGLSTLTDIRDLIWVSELGQYFAVGTAASSVIGIYSSDGITWTSGGGSGTTAAMFAICWSPDLREFVAVNASTIFTSQTASGFGGIWVSGSISGLVSGFSTPTPTDASIAWGGGSIQKFVIVFNGRSANTTNSIIYSSDGSNWTAATYSIGRNWSSVCYSPQLNTFVAVGDSSTAQANIVSSTNGTSWTATTTTTSVTAVSLKKVIWIQEVGIFLGIGSSGHIYSTNGTSWSSLSIPTANTWGCVAWAPEIDTLSVLASGTTNATNGIFYTTQSAISNVSLLTNASSLYATNTSKSSITTGNHHSFLAPMNSSFRWLTTRSSSSGITSSEVMRLSHDGNLGIGLSNNTNAPLTISTTNTSQAIQLMIEGSSNLNKIYSDGNGYLTLESTAGRTLVKNDLNVNGDIIVGTSGPGPNELRFAGVTQDVGNNAYTVITERLYGGSDKSELLLFKGNDVDTISGPDRIRLRGGQLVFQVHNNEDYTSLGDDRTVLTVGSNRVVLIGKTTTSNTGNWMEVASGASGYSALFDGWVGIGTGSSTPVAPLEIGLSNSGSLASATYAYNNGGTSWTVITANPSGVSLKTSGRIYCGGELDVVSDYRLKENIQNITLEMSKKFITKIEPKTFNYKKQPDITSFGYVAQDILKNEFHHLVQLYLNEDAKEYTDEDNFTSPEGKSFAVSLTNVIPILHVSIKDLYDQKNKLEEEVQELRNENQILKQQMQLILERLDNLESK